MSSAGGELDYEPQRLAGVVPEGRIGDASMPLEMSLSQAPKRRPSVSTANSRNVQSKKNPAQIVLQNVFGRFVRAAELKVNTLIYTQPLDREVDLFNPFCAGADPAFDALLESVGSVSKHCPKLMIDSIMVWRKSKSENANSEGSRNVPNVPNLKGKDLEHIVKERKSLVSNFILCRVLIAIIQRLTRETLPDDLEEKLEDMVFGQLRNADPDMTVRSVNRQANIDLFAELVGSLSSIRFASVSGRFINELSKTVALKEGKLDLIIRSMRFLKLKIFPMDALEDTADFLQTSAELFQNAHTTRIKHAYAEVFVQLLEPIAAVATAEVNLPAWMKTVELIFPKANKMLGKPRHLAAALPLISTLLSVSRKDFFHKHWGDFTDLCLKHLRDKQLRVIALCSLVRLAWVYLFRCSETSTSNMHRRIDFVTRVLFPSSRRSVLPPDTNWQSLTQYVYYVCVRFPEYGIDNLLTNLLGIEHHAPTVSVSGGGTSGSSASLISTSSVLTGVKDYGSSVNGITVSSSDEWSGNTILSTLGSSSSMSTVPLGETLTNPERLIIALRAFLLLLADMEDALGGGHKDSSGLTAGTVSAVNGSLGGGKVVVEGKINLPSPPFPRWEATPNPEYVGIAELVKMRERGTSDSRQSNIRELLSESVLNRMGTSMKDSIERFNDALGKVASSLDNTCGWSMLTETGLMLATMNALGSAAAGLRRGSVSDTANSNGSGGGTEKDGRSSVLDVVSKDRQLLYDLMHTYIDCLPRIVPSGISAVALVDMLSRYVLHSDDGVRRSAGDALQRISSIALGKGHPAPKYWHFGEEHPLMRDIVRIAADTGTSLLNDRVLDIFTNLPFDGTQGATHAFAANYISLLETWLQDIKKSLKTWDAMEVDWVVEEVESRGLLLLCSQIPAVRRQALVILQMAVDLESAMKGTDPHGLDASFAGLSKDEVRRETLRRQSRHDLRRWYTLHRKLHHPDMRSHQTRIRDILEKCGPDLVRRFLLDPVLAFSTRSEHQKSQQQACRPAQGITLIQVIGSESQQDTVIWARCFPDLIKWCFQYANPRTLQMCLRDICARLSALQSSIIAASEASNTTGGKGTTTIPGTVKWGNDRGNANTHKTASASVIPLTDEMVDQWRVYMVYACACIEIYGSMTTDASSTTYNHTKAHQSDRSRPDPTANKSARELMLHTISSAHDLLQMVFPLLHSEKASIRKAAVSALSSINSQSYHTFLEDVQPLMRSVVDDLRTRAAVMRGDIKESTRKPGSSQALAHSAQAKRSERLRMELTHVMSLLADFVGYVQHRRNANFMANMMTYVRELARFLSDNEVQYEWDHQMLRYYFSGFIERLYDYLVAAVGDSDSNEAGSPDLGEESLERHIPFDLRLGLFRLFEKWCGYGQFSARTRDREAKMMLSVLDQVKDIRERGALTSTMEEQRKALETASLKAMAALCKGPVVNPRDPSQSFDFGALVTWINSIFASPDEKFHVIARAALEALLTHNRRSEQLLIDVVKQCYVGDVDSNVTMGYFMALVDIFTREDGYPCSPARMCALSLYKAGDPNLHIRRGAIRLLRAIEARFWEDPMTDKSKYSAVISLAKDFFGPPSRLADLDAHMLDREIDQGDMHERLDDEAAMMAAMALIDEEHATYEAAAIASQLPIVYKYAQAMISARLANERADMTHEMLSEMVYTLEIVAMGNGVNSGYPQGVHDILVLMVPWVRNVQLSADGPDPSDSSQKVRIGSPSHTVLMNLFYLTVKYGDEHVAELENIWMQLVEPTGNAGKQGGLEGFAPPSQDRSNSNTLSQHTNMIIDFLLDIGVQKRNPKFVTHAKKVIVYLARTVVCSHLVDALIGRINPKSMIPTGLEESGLAPDNRGRVKPEMIGEGLQPNATYHEANLEQVLVDMPKRPAFSKGQLACVLLVDLAVELGSALRAHLPLLLHVIFVQLDHFITLICEQNRLLLINIIQSTIPRDVAGKHIDTVHAALSLKEGKRLWAFEDITPKEQDIESQHQLGALVMDVLELFFVVDPNIAQSWGETALMWGTTCPVRHAACRSLQIFRTLMPAFSQRMLGELLQRLANTLADPTLEIQGFALEIVMTLNSMVNSLDGSRLILFPQLFWAAVACLHSPHEWEYAEGLALLEKILAKLGVEEPSCRNILLINLPTKWKGQFTGLQPLLLRGLSSSSTDDDCLRVINTLASLTNSTLVDSAGGRLLFAMLANLPRWLQCFEGTRGADKDAEGSRREWMRTAQTLADLSEHDALSRLLSSFAKRKIRTREDFLKQLISLIQEEYFPQREGEVWQFLMGLLSNPRLSTKAAVLSIIKGLLSAIPSRDILTRTGSMPPVAMTEMDEDFIAPLLSILHTELASEALEVLDEILSGSIPSGEANLRLVFGGKSIYKIAREAGNGPELLAPGSTPRGEAGEHSGWWVKDFAAFAKIARYNMTGVASTCGGARESGRQHSTVGRSGAENDTASHFSSLRPTSNVLVGGTSRDWKAPPLGTDKTTSSTGTLFTGWEIDDLDGNLLNTLDDLDAFFGRDDEHEAEYGQKSLAIDSHTVTTSDDSNLDEVGNLENSFSQENMTKQEGKEYPEASAGEVFHHPERPVLTRDVSLSSIFVNGILGGTTGLDDNLPQHIFGMTSARSKSKIPDSASGKQDIPKQTTVTPAKRLLMHAGATPFLTFRLKRQYQELVQDPEFGHWLCEDLANALEVETNRVFLEKVEPEESGTGATVLITVTITAAEPTESAAYIELLAELLGTPEPESNQGKKLSEGVVTWSLDREFKPDLFLSFMGLTVPYLPEGLKDQITAQDSRAQPQEASFTANDDFRPPSPMSSLSPQNVEAQKAPNQVALTLEKPISLEDGVELFRIFPASFELSMQLVQDWIDFATDCLQDPEGSGPTPPDAMAEIIALVEELFTGPSAYTPPPIDSDLHTLSEQLLQIQQDEPAYLLAFIVDRQQHVDAMNVLIKEYLSYRHVVGESARELGDGQVAMLGCKVLELYMEVLNLEGILETFLGVEEQRRIYEVDATQERLEKCRALCSHFVS
ncbi:cell morphogenesis N-terminal-domain-containing protein [Fimicolochytrium jonesii]|uniref:cell morphogenesis N-terminal-domain-containing protein n=1 Tax=Fimicolochytrium jonesii TaxID=1396493 RepID=UPI0022FE96CE|nr:cell morphogenesis N-terminal-domain-containing protein [Fimicolochytrium jonesii]KAI8820541.1 cell morphogenesis N-terminal-domain-containing protein [Fimicolochytrium jonesii]